MTLRELYEFGMARLRQRWAEAAFVAAYAFNSNPYLSRMITPRQIDPMSEPEPEQKISLETAMRLLHPQAGERVADIMRDVQSAQQQGGNTR